MSRRKEKSDNFLNLMVDCQTIETENIRYSEKEIPMAKNPFVKTILKSLKLEAEKRCVMEQMIVEGIRKEAIHLSPEEVEDITGHLNRYLGAIEKASSLTEEALGKSELALRS